MHTTGTGQPCEGRHCLQCGKCEACSHKAKTPTALLTRSHTPHSYEVEPASKTRAKRTRRGATV